MESGVGGIVSPTRNRKTTSASRIVISRLTFSPDSTGRKKPRNEMRKIRKHGAIRLMTYESEMLNLTKTSRHRPRPRPNAETQIETKAPIYQISYDLS